MAENTQKTKKGSGRIATYFRELKSEFKKITWPDKHSTFKQSVAVVAISVVVGLIIAMLDYVIQYGVNILTSI